MEKQRTQVNTTAVALAAVAAGFCNALIGAGGGILLTLVLAASIPQNFPDRRQLLVVSQAAMIPGCLLSAIIYASEGMLNTSSFAVFALPALLGGAIGSFLLRKLKPNVIGGIFSVLVIFSGFRMIRG